MEIRQLEYLVEVADQASFTRAAQRLHVAQPGISAQVKQLEREVGHVLFERGPRAVRPTDAGVELLRHARTVLGALDDARDAMDALAGLVRGRVDLGTVRGVPLGSLAELLGRFHRAHPGVEVTLREAESATLVDQLRSGELDAALIGLATGDEPDGIVSHVVTDDRLVVLVGEDDRWAARRSATLADVAERAVIVLAPGTGMRTAFDAACGRAGLVAHVAFEVGAVATAAELARAGLGVAVVPATAARGPLGHGLHAVAIVRPVVRSRLALAWARQEPAQRRPALRALIVAIEELLASRDGVRVSG